MDNNMILGVKDLNISIPLHEGLLTPVRGVNFDMKKGETVGLVGESGCGKSLTCRAILAINEKKCKASGKIEENLRHEVTGVANSFIAVSSALLDQLIVGLLKKILKVNEMFQVFQLFDNPLYQKIFRFSGMHSKPIIRINYKRMSDNCQINYPPSSVLQLANLSGFV